MKEQPKTTRAEFDYILQIANRAAPLYAEFNLPDSKLTISMDLEFAHASCPIDLPALLAADDRTFNHDVLGIRKHMDRTLGKLYGCFVPRTAVTQ